MSYLYDNLKEALGGKYVTENKGSVINDWTPNSIRSIIITRNYILIVNHLGVFGGCTRKIDLDVTKVASDLDSISKSNYGKPKLNSLLTKRSLSCLEEIYVDAMFMNYPRVLDLVGYVKELINSNSRLRYFGYGNFPENGQVLREHMNRAYLNAYSKKDFGYSLAKDLEKPVQALEYKDVENTEWYTKYYLRPQFYIKDKQGGQLDTHFKKIEDGYEEYLNNKHVEETKGDYYNKIMVAVGRDLSNTDYFVKVDKILSYLSKTQDSVGKLVFASIRPVLLKDRKIEGLNKKVLEQLNGDREFLGKYMLGCYEKYGVLDKSAENKLSIEECLKDNDGFIKLGKILDELCCEVSSVLIKRGYKDLVGMALVCISGSVPSGRFADEYLKGNGNGSYQGYIDYIEEVIGVEV